MDRIFDFEISEGVSQDIDQVLEWKYDKERFKKFLNEFIDHERKLFVIRTNKYCIGHVFVNTINTSTIDIQSLELAEPFRGKGIGTDLVKYVESIYRLNGFISSQIGGYKDEEDNLKRYKKWGYVKVVDDGFCDAAQKEYWQLEKNL